MSDRYRNMISPTKTIPKTSSIAKTKNRCSSHKLFDEKLYDRDFVNLAVRDDQCAATSTPAKESRHPQRQCEQEFHPPPVPVTGDTDDIKILPSHPHFDTDLPHEPITVDTQMIKYTDTKDIPKLDYFLKSMNITMIPPYLQNTTYNDLDENYLKSWSASLIEHCVNCFNYIIGLYTNPEQEEGRPNANDTKHFLLEMIQEFEQKYFISESPLRMRELNRNICPWAVRDPMSEYKYYQQWITALEYYIDMDFNRINATSNDEGHRHCNIMLLIYTIIVGVFQHDLPLFWLFDFINDLNYDYSNIYAIPIQHRINLEYKLLRFYNQSRSNVKRDYFQTLHGLYDWRDNMAIAEYPDQPTMDLNITMQQPYMGRPMNAPNPIVRQTRASQATYNRLYRGNTRNLRFFR